MSEPTDKVISKEPNEKEIAELQKKKLEARDKLRGLRIEMKKLDIELIHSGADHADLQLFCW